MSGAIPEVRAGMVSTKPVPAPDLIRNDLRKSKKIGRHRKEDPSGNIFYKKAPQDHISGAMQLGNGQQFLRTINI